MTTAAERAAAALPTEMPLDSRLAIGRAKIKAFRWPKGQTGRTPSAKLYYEARRIARQAAPDVMKEIVRLALEAEDERVRSVCGVAVLDRAGVRPIDFDPNEEKATKPRFNPRDYTPEELDLIEAAFKLMADRSREIATGEVNAQARREPQRGRATLASDALGTNASSLISR